MVISKNKETALKYSKILGFSIIPLNGKKPITPNGYKDATSDLVQIEKWWQEHPKANIGIATGEVNDIVVIDVDVDHDKGKYGDESLDELITELGPLPSSWECITGSGGRHLYFKYPTGHSIRNSASVLGENIDVRANGGYIVAPPSVHPDTGREYTWECGGNPEDIPLAELPEKWIERMESQNQQKKQKNQKSDQNTNQTKEAAEPFKLPTVVPEGQRNDVMFRYGASLRAKKVSAKDILDKLEEQNQSKCKPPLTNTEIEMIYALIKDNDMTKNDYYNTTVIMRQGMEYALDAGIIKDNPFPSVKIDGRRMFRKVQKKADSDQVFSREESRQICEMAWEDYRNRVKFYELAPLCMMFQMQTGLRVGEAVVVKFSDIETPDYIHIQRMVRRDEKRVIPHTKSDCGDRYVLLTSTAKELVETARSRQKELGVKSEYIFSTGDEPISAYSVQELYRKYCRKLGIWTEEHKKYKNSHAARRTFSPRT